jgi:hypothetical protein
MLLLHISLGLYKWFAVAGCVVEAYCSMHVSVFAVAELLLQVDLDLSQCVAVAEYAAVAGRPGPVPVLVDVGCGGGSRPDHLAWHTQ